jgi:hypothetical protein
MWQLQPEDDYLRRAKWFEKKRLREYEAVAANLKKYFSALTNGARPNQIVGKFVHPEPGGVKALDQSGSKGKLSQTRLYVFPDEDSFKLHLITLGDKQSQPDDIKTCKNFIASLRADKEAKNHEQDKDVQQRRADDPGDGGGC